MIKVQTAGDCCIVTLARPDKANALTEGRRRDWVADGCRHL